MTYVSDYSSISPTAKLVADLRRFSEIPFAKDVAQKIGAEAAMADIVGQNHLDPETLRWLAPMLEARYQSLVQAIHASGCRQVLEFASGFSLRGAAMTAGDEGLRYIETDLPGVHSERIRVIHELETEHKLKPANNLISTPVNLMNAEEVARVEALLEPGQPVAIIHEGLFPYLTHDEKREAALRIRGILERHGGVWLTPDFDKLSDMTDLLNSPQLASIGSFLAQATRRDVVGNAFKDDAQLAAFFDELGFDYTTTPQIDGSYPLTSGEVLGISGEELEQLKRSRKLWWLKPRGHSETSEAAAKSRLH